MSLQDIASLGKQLAHFPALFADCSHDVKGRRLFAAYVRGLLSELGRNNVEAIALKQGVVPRTLLRFLEFFRWDHDEVLRRCRKWVVTEQSDPQAIRVIDETGTAKAARETVGVQRQYNGNQGKVENVGGGVVVGVGVGVGVALAFATATFHRLIAARLYLPEEWANIPVRRKKLDVPNDIEFLTKPQIALVLIDQALPDGITVKAWTVDELYGRDGKFLHGLDQQKQAFLGEVPPDFGLWPRKPKILRKPHETCREVARGVAKSIPVWQPVMRRPARCVTWRNTRLLWPATRRSDTACAIRTKVPKSGKFAGMWVIAERMMAAWSVRNARSSWLGMFAAVK